MMFFLKGLGYYLKILVLYGDFFLKVVGQGRFKVFEKMQVIDC